MDWDDIKVFMAISQTGSVLGAARELNLNPSTVTRRIKSFEERLKARLFDRHATGYQLTEAGKDLLATATEISDTMVSLERRLAGCDEEIRGKVLLSLPYGAADALRNAIGRFLQEYPDIELNLLEGMKMANLSKREADVAVRLTETPHPTLFGRKIGEVAGTLYASPEYIERAKTEQVPSFIAPLTSPKSPARVTGTIDSVRVVARADSPLSRLNLAQAGVGLTWLPCFIGDDPKHGVVRAHTERPLDRVPMWVLTHPDLKGVRRVDVLLRLIADEARQNADLLGGRCETWPRV